MTPGIDFHGITHDTFKTELEKAQDERIASTWTICDLNVFAKDNPEYDDIYQQYRDETKVSEGSIQKYNSTIRTFPKSRRKWNLSIEMYYTVAGLRDENGNPLHIFQDELLRQVVKHQLSGVTGLRDWLRAEVKKIKRMPLIDKEVISCAVGSIDDTLRKYHALPDGYEVQVTIARTRAYDTSELEETIGEMAA